MNPTPAQIAEQLQFPLSTFKGVSWLDALLGYTPFKALMPLPILALLAPGIYLFFRKTWKALDQEATEHRLALSRSGGTDFRPAVALGLVAAILTLQEYYGGRTLFESIFRPWLTELQVKYPQYINLAKWGDFYGYCWWVGARVIGYVFVPFALWKVLFPKDSLLDMGLRGRGFFSHLWIYGLCLAVVLPAMWAVAHQPDFGTYYPFYKLSSRSWFDLLLWEGIYGLQFFALELFFRGWMLGALRRSLGSSAIFVMAVPYCMIHYGKPYLEAHGAIVAGIVLGSLSMRTRSIYAGFLVHITVAYLMDIGSLWHRAALPTVFWPS
ncbi:MAG: CPBP family intramembrane glutamic endopeptidase [Polyangiaceae bacterium]|nr:CPBP family intramembrane glutamic endopeptidase [Polyangiaceae bacterium]